MFQLAKARVLRHGVLRMAMQLESVILFDWAMQLESAIRLAFP